MRWPWSLEARIERALERLKSDDPEVRCKGCYALRDLGEDAEPARAALIRAFSTDPEKNVRLVSGMALQRLQPDAASMIDVARHALSDEHPFVRDIGAALLKSLGKPAAASVPDLIRAWLRPDPSPVAFQTRDAIFALLPHLESRDDTTRQGLERLAASGRLDGPQLEGVVAKLIELFPERAGGVILPALRTAAEKNAYLRLYDLLEALTKCGLGNQKQVVDFLEILDVQEKHDFHKTSWRHQDGKAAEAILRATKEGLEEGLRTYLKRHGDEGPRTRGWHVARSVYGRDA